MKIFPQVAHQAHPTSSAPLDARSSTQQEASAAHAADLRDRGGDECEQVDGRVGPLAPDRGPQHASASAASQSLGARTPTSALDSTRSIESEIIALFVDLMRCFGAPKSLGAIYGLLFVSEKPIPFEQIMTRLRLSSGSVSQGLRLLKELGAATVVFVPGDRRDHYTAETRLRQLAAGFLRRRVDAEFTNAGERLSRVVDQFTNPQPSADAGSHAFLAERVAILARWQKQARQLLPAALQALSGEQGSREQGAPDP